MATEKVKTYRIEVVSKGLEKQPNSRIRKEKLQPSANKDKDPTPSSEQESSSSSFNKFRTTLSVASKFVGSSGAVGVISKAVPAIAIIRAAIKLIDKTATAVTNYEANYAGYSQYSSSYNNFKQVFKNISNPVSVFTGFVNQRLEENKKQIENAERSRLIGYANSRNIYKGF